MSNACTQVPATAWRAKKAEEVARERNLCARGQLLCLKQEGGVGHRPFPAADSRLLVPFLAPSLRVGHASTEEI